MTAPEQAVRTATRYHRTPPYSLGVRSLCGQPLTFILDRKPVDEVPDADRCRRCWNRPVGARLERSSLQQRQGARALGDGTLCGICDGTVLKDQRIVKRGDSWVHAACVAREHS